MSTIANLVDDPGGRMRHKEYAFGGRVVMLGYGSVGQGTLPLLLRHIAMLPDLGDVVGVYGDWTPLVGRDWLFDEDIDHEDPWQFKNFRVA